MRPLRIIGTLHSCFREKFATPRQAMIAKSATATLRLSKEFVPEHSLRGLEGFSHVWLVSLFHLNTNKTFRPTVHPPRLRGKRMGVFATRSPHRPSAIGLTLARLDAVKKDTLYLSGIDLVEGTPILDVKPYLPCDQVPKAATGWAGKKAFPRLKVRLSPLALKKMKTLEKTRKGLRSLLKEVLGEDPRNSRDRLHMTDGRLLGFFLFDLNIRFSVTKGTATVHDLETGKTFTKENRSRQHAPTTEVK